MKELKNGRSRLVSFDTTAFSTVVNSKGFGMTELSKVLDYTPNYFNKCIRNKKIGLNAMQLLYSKLGIRPEMYSDLNVNDLPEKIVVKKKVADPAKPAKAKVLEKIAAKKKANTPEPTNNMITVQVSLDSDQLKALIKEAVIEAFESL